jgi:hypothetical protein
VAEPANRALLTKMSTRPSSRSVQVSSDVQVIVAAHIRRNEIACPPVAAMGRMWSFSVGAGTTCRRTELSPPRTRHIADGRRREPRQIDRPRPSGSARQPNRSGAESRPRPASPATSGRPRRTRRATRPDVRARRQRPWSRTVHSGQSTCFEG